MRSLILRKSVGLFSVLAFALNAVAANNVPNLTTDQFHLTGQTASKILTLDAQKKAVSSAYGTATLDTVNNATSSNTPSTLVIRDGSGNFSAGTITGNLTGNVVGNLTGTATSASTTWTFVNQSTTYSANLGDWVYANGPSFTITLPDATIAGSSGRPIYVQHAGVSLTQIYQINTTGGQTVTAAPDNTAYTSGQISLYTNNEQFEFRVSNGNWVVTIHKSETDWKDLGNWMQYITFTTSSASATLAAVYSPAETFTLVAAGNSTAAATYVPGYIFTVTAAAATAAATYQPGYLFTVTAANATLAAVYKDTNGASYTVAATIAAQTQLVLTGTATPPAGPGVLTLFSGVGDATINYSSLTGNPTTFATFTDQVTIAGGTTLTTTSPVANIGTLAATGKLVKLAGTGDAVITYSAATGFASGTTTCTTANTIVTLTSIVMTCTAPPPSVATLVKTAGSGDIPLPYNAVTGEDTASGVKAYRVAQTQAAQLVIITQSEGALPSNSSGKLGKISGTGDAVITYSAVAGALNTLLGTTTNPTFYGSPALNNWKWRRNGRYGELWVNYYQSVAQGIIGSGDYLFPWIPNTLIDTTRAPASQSFGGGVQGGTSQAEQPALTQFRWPAFGSLDQQSAAYGNWVEATPWSTTYFRPWMLYNLADWRVDVGSTFMPPSVAIAYNLRAIFPVQGWIP